jgi:hypothetical protein
MGNSDKGIKARTKADQVVNGAGGAEVVLAHDLADGGASVVGKHGLDLPVVRAPRSPAIGAEPLRL